MTDLLTSFASNVPELLWLLQQVFQSGLMPILPRFFFDFLDSFVMSRECEQRHVWEQNLY